MAKLLDVERPDVDETQQQEEPQQTELAFETTQETQPQEELPDKYRGKSTAEIVRMHQEAEKLLGKQSSEVGELRKVVDNYIQGQTELKQDSQPEEEIDFFSDPEKAIQRQIERHPKILEAEKIQAEYRQQTAKAQLERLHPDMSTIVQDKGFQEWVTASKVRQKLFQQADKMYDYETADELLNLWKDRQQTVQQTAQTEKKERKQAVKAASTGTTKGSTAPSSKKIYRRADIIKLMKEDPDRYQSLSGEIMQAYAERRVR